jgi:aminoglycoside phosphotransferase (APT) family kinase protein
MNNQGSLDEWLQGRHSSWATPQSIIAAFVAKASGSKLRSSNRLIIGQDNEVYDALTADGQQIIVRVSHKEDPRFEAEKWALDAARQAGVPTPQVLLIEEAEYDGHKVTFCVEEKLPGEPLDVAIEKGEPHEFDGAIKEVGYLLSKIHSVQVEGFGYLQPDGRGWEIPFSSIMLDLNEKQAELGTAAKQWGVASDDITQGLSLLNQNVTIYGFDTPSLVHGDYGLPHILVENNQVTGIIDMQECSGNHPIFDLVHWDTTSRDVIPADKLVASYDNQDLFDGDYETLFHLVLLRKALWMLMVHVEHENPHGVEGFKADIERALRFFSLAK